MKPGKTFWNIFLPALLLLFVPVIVFAAAEGDPRHANDGRAQTLATQTANELERLLQMRMKQTFALAALPSFRAYASSDITQRAGRATVALREMEALVQADKEIREVFITDALGFTILASSNKFGVNWAHREFVANALQGKLDASPPARDGGEFSSFYASPIIDNGGNVAGALVLRIVAQEVWNTVYAARETNCCYAVLSDENGVRLADAGDQTKNFYAWAALDSPTVSRLVGSQQYGAEMAQWRNTNAPTVARALKQATPPARIDADGYQGAVAKLQTKPWTVFVVTTSPIPIPYASLPLGLAILAAVICAAGLTWWIKAEQRGLATDRGAV